MSRASKITLALTSAVTAVVVVGVHYVQDMERQTLHQGPIKDAKRMAEKRLKESTQTDPSKERQKILNRNEHEYQLELRKKYEELQPLSGEIRTQDNEFVRKE